MTTLRRADSETIENIKKMIASGCLTNHEQSVLENLVKEFETPDPIQAEKEELAHWLYMNCSDKEYGYKAAPWLDAAESLREWFKAHGWRHD